MALFIYDGNIKQHLRGQETALFARDLSLNRIGQEGVLDQVFHDSLVIATWSCVCTYATQPRGTVGVPGDSLECGEFQLEFGRLKC